MAKTVRAIPDEDYAQSANVLFHFMTKMEYLEDILQKHALVPRYCMENLEYLNLTVGGTLFREALVLQKCFCDIPLHKLMDTFKLELVGDIEPKLTAEEQADLARRNTHPDCYGQYAVAFSKRWGETHQLQPIQYINSASEFAKDFCTLFGTLFDMEDLSEELANDALNRLAFMKPLRGVMDRNFERKGRENVVVRIFKNFHDEKEWRYVPSSEVLSRVQLERIIANPTILKIPEIQRYTNTSLAADTYRALWLNFRYDDIRYMIVPNSTDRISLIDFILSLPEEQFDDAERTRQSKLVLISKILVLEEIRKDW